MARIKIRRKDLRRPDEFVELTTRAWEWIVDNRTLAVTVAVVLVSLLVVATTITQYRNFRYRDAAESFRKANALLEAGDAVAALDAFAHVRPVGAYAALAQLARGNAAVRAGRLPVAAEAFRKVIASSELPEYLRQEALYNLAFVLSKQSQQAKAREYFEQAAEMSGPYRLDARLSAARLNDALGRIDQARSLYAQAIEDADSLGQAGDDLRRLADARLAALGRPAESPHSSNPPD